MHIIELKAELARLQVQLTIERARASDEARQAERIAAAAVADLGKVREELEALRAANGALERRVVALERRAADSVRLRALVGAAVRAQGRQAGRYQRALRNCDSGTTPANGTAMPA